MLVGSLVLALGASSAQATSVVIEPPSDQLSRASIAVEAVVVARQFDMVDDNEEPFPVTYYDLGIRQTHLGRVVSGRIRLVLPGGPLGDGRWVDVDAPLLEPGEHVFLIGTHNDDRIIHLTGFTQSLFIRGGDADRPLALSANRDPVGGLDCQTSPWLVRPLDQAPSTLFDGVAMTPEEALSFNHGPVFVETPAEWGVDWTALIETFRGCIATSPNPGTVLGGDR